MSSPSYVPLHVHSDFSFFQGASKVGEYVDQAESLGLPALAITDTDAMYGALTLSTGARKKGVQPILGAQVSLPTGHLVFLAQNQEGYQNLSAIVHEINRLHAQGNTDTNQPFIALMKNGRTRGLICLTGSRNGLIQTALVENDEKAEQRLGWLKSTYGDRLYVEIARNGCETDEDIVREQKLIELAFKHDVGLVATNDIYYADRKRHEAWEIMQAVNNRGKIALTDEGVTSSRPRSFYMRSAEDMQKLFADIPEAVDNTLEIAKRCTIIAEERDPMLPAFKTQGGISETEELARQARIGLQERIKEDGIADSELKTYEDRLEHELKIIDNMGFPGYFLIVADFIQWAKDNRIPVGPGRGSGAGSLVAYSLRITDLDPLRWGLLFERFLNPDRVSMPDFDVDFCQDRRGEVIHYVQDKYGGEQVAHIVTFGEMKSKMAIKDCGRVLQHDTFGGFGFNETNRITSAAIFPTKPASAEPMGLSDALDASEELADLVKGNQRYSLLWDQAKRIEGLYRQVGAHAAGVVIGDRPLHELIPMGWDPQADMPVTQFNMKDAEKSGLVKFDFLGLKTLSVIQLAIDMIESTRNKKVDISQIPLDDPEVFDLLERGNTNGVFQLESPGMKSMLREMRPDRFEDIIAAVALYRPGPMENIPFYNACKHGDEEPDYPVPADRTKPILEETFGIIVYQEQVMQVAQEVAGYSLGQADLLRRAMGKKIKAEMDAQQKTFVDGAVSKGVSKKDAEQLFAHIAKFASYGFNKSHAAAYALIAYQTAWLKRHYPAEFFAAFMSYEKGNPERLAAAKDNLGDMGIPLLQPDINRSRNIFWPEAHPKAEGGFAVRFGLSAIKNCPSNVDAFLKERDTNGLFSDLVDFHMRTMGYLNKSQLERFTEAGAFDGLYQNRAATADALAWLLKNVKEKSGSNGDLFSDSRPEVPPKVFQRHDWGDIAEREFNSVGFYFNTHPIDPYLNRLKKAGVRRRKSIESYMLEKKQAELSERLLCVMVDHVFKKTSKTGNEYLSVKVSEKADHYQFPIFAGYGINISQIFRVLDAARNSRVPCVITADFTLENDGVSLRGRKATLAPDHVKKISGGDFAITIDYKDIIPARRQRQALRSSEGDEKKKIENEIIDAKARQFVEAVEPFRSEDDKGSTLDLFAIFPDGQMRRLEHLSGNPYKITEDFHTAYRDIDGLVSAKEL